MAQFCLDQFVRVKYDAMHCCPIAQSQLGPVNIDHDNGDEDGDDGQADDQDIYHDHDDQDDDCDYMTINLNHGYGNNFELNHMQDVDMSKGVDRCGDYDNDYNINDNGDGHIDLEGPLGSYKEYIR